MDKLLQSLHSDKQMKGLRVDIFHSWLKFGKSNES